MVPRGSQQEFRLTNTFHPLGPLMIGAMHVGSGFSWRLDGLASLTIGKLGEGRLERTSIGRTARFCQGEAFLLSEPHRPYEVWWEKAIDFDILMIEQNQFSDLVDRYVPSRTGLPRFTGVGPVTTAMSAYCARVLDFVKAEAVDEVTSDTTLVQDSVGRLVAATILATFPHAVPELVIDHGDVSSLPVRRAVEFIEAHAEDAIGLAEIAQHTGIGARALQLAFRRHLDQTPTAYVRRVRLDRAHQDLTRGSRLEGDSVTAIAMRWGFGHLGRFAATYRDAYGRTPRETLERSSS